MVFTNQLPVPYWVPWKFYKALPGLILEVDLTAKKGT